MSTSSGLKSPFDEMRHSSASQEQREILGVLDRIGSAGLSQRAKYRDTYMRQHGITFNLGAQERPLPVDLVPRLITSQEWEVIEAGVIQRIKALEAFLADVYGSQLVFRDKIIPRSLVTSSPYFYRQAWGIQPPNGVRIHVAGIDLVRDEQGGFRVLEDNLRNPSGVSYVLENRRILGHVLPEIFGRHRVRGIADYPERLHSALLAAAPANVRTPNVVVLTPGVHNSAHYEHSFLARYMGVELVEGRDLYYADGQVFMRTTAGPKPVDVIYRRIDDDYLDPINLKPDSILGVPGLLNAARAGRVTIANAVGNGVGDDKAIYPYVPALIKYYLDEEPILPNVHTYDLSDCEQLTFVLDRLDQLVIKPVDGSGGYGILIGPQATDTELDRIRMELTENPRAWIAQDLVSLSTSPTVEEDGRLVDRRVDLRPFAINDGESIFVLPGGLTRVALQEDGFLVNSSQGGGAKDTWVLDDGSERHRSVPMMRRRAVSAVIEIPDRDDAPELNQDRKT
jgi:uncharacterized circularly permuted ATP-grasp superfamily protein